MERGQFTFYRSFWEAIKRLSKKDRLFMLETIIMYALDGTEPAALTTKQTAIFALIKPVLKTARRKAIGGKSAAELPPKNTNKKEKEEEIEKENEIEIENECSGARDSDFEKFWSLYPKQVGKEQARKAFARVHVPVQVLLDAVAQHRQSTQWIKDGGAFIPNPATWLAQKRWEDRLPQDKMHFAGASGHLGRGELDNIRRLMEGK